MSKPSACAALALDLAAAATGEAPEPVAVRVDAHVAGCGPCRDDYARYAAVDAAVGALRAAPAPESTAARERLLARLADLRTRLLRYGVFRTPLGPVLVATTEHGIAVVEYLERRGARGSWILGRAGLEAEADDAALAPYHRELMDYLAGRRTRLDWPLDLRFAASDFQRAVLRATAGIPYGAVSSYAGIAADIGKPAAVRAVAQALRHNPVPIVVPCHRVIGSGGALVGYAGSRLGLKERLLGVEGVRTERRRRELRIARRALYAWDHRSDRQYCLPTCGDVSAQPIGKVTLFASQREAKAAGLTPCPDCRPDLHPLRAA